jgi:cell division protein FtsW (lipid II flippase)
MTENIQSRLLRRAALFLIVYSLILTLSPAVRERSWDVDYRFAHWLGMFAWLGLVYLSHRASIRQLQDHDPYLFSAAAFLAGWGLLTIWRLDEGFGLKQTVWLSISLLIFTFSLRLPHNLVFLRQYKYVLLTSGLILTALTIIFGTNPMGFGPRLWLGCCGVYFQPSELLKLLLVIYLAAYLADRPTIQLSTLPLLIPTLALTGLALTLLVVQRDLGTASIFILLFTTILFVVTGKKRVLVGTVAALIFSLTIGYFFINIIQIRINGWINPWDDPAGDSYQIVQSLLAVANGGVLGRGPGLGNPLLVPVAISDFIFSAIAEETGLVGTVGLLAAIWLILSRGMVAALRAADRFRRFLATGIVAYIGIQSLLIIGGNIRLLPLTGVTLPFVSYGGSSLLTSFIAILLLVMISTHEENEPAALTSHLPYSTITGILGVGFAVLALAVGWWGIIRGPDLLNRTDNARRAIADRYVERGQILDRNNAPINTTEGESGSYERVYLYPDLAPITGYTHPIFGQAGLEFTLDDYLRGLQGNPSSLIWWDHLLYGTPPPGLDVRLSIDLAIQEKADELLGDHAGALILMNANTGEILAMASHPVYDPNKLDEEGAQLSRDETAPLVNRATQGLYPIGTSLQPIYKIKFNDNFASETQLNALFIELGFYQTPVINIPLAGSFVGESTKDLRISPLQMALAASVLGNHGTMPAPRISMAMNTPEQGWVILPSEGKPRELYQASATDEAAMSYIVEGRPYWSHTGQANIGEDVFTWLIAGTVPDWGGTPLVLVVTLEEDNIPLAETVRTRLLDNIVK